MSANAETLLRLIQSVPSPKATGFESKKTLAIIITY